MAFGEWLRHKRRALDLTQGELANRAGCARITIQKLEAEDLRPSKQLAEALAQVLGISPSEREAFVRYARTGESGPRVIEIPNNLPAPFSSFVGREKQVREITDLLSQTRLLTLSGAGGVGKTRLALRVANESLDSFKEGVWWVDLVGLTDGDSVPYALASTLGLRPVGDQLPQLILANHLRPQQALVVLDNCEHLIKACSELAGQLLSACPRLEILTTSREPLGITGEIIWRVPSLSLPDAQRPPRADEIIAYEGIRLFLERARAVKPEFSITDQNARVLAQICERLDGIPLALELAAARVQMLSVNQIAERLGRRFELLTQGSRTELPRHKTLNATIDWSYDLLSEMERDLFRSLSIFVGGWTLEAAEAVCPGPRIEQGQVLELLSRLVDKSLVIVEERDGIARYRMLETIREYALEKQTRSSDTSSLRARHMEFFLKLAEASQPRLFSVGWVPLSERLDAEYENLKAAFEWSLENGRAESAMRLAIALARSWHPRSYLADAEFWLSKALTAKGMSSGLTRARALMELGRVQRWRGNLPPARSNLEAALALSQQAGDRKQTVDALFSLSQVALSEGDLNQAQLLTEQSMALRRELGDKSDLASASSQLGELARIQRDYAQAERHYLAGLALAREAQNESFTLIILQNLGSVAVQKGEYAKASEFLRESITGSRKTNFRWLSAHCLAAMGTMAVRGGQAEHAARLLGAAEALLDTIGGKLDVTDRAEYEAGLAAIRSQLDTATFERAWAEGRALTPEEAIELALEGPPEQSTQASRRRPQNKAKRRLLPPSSNSGVDLDAT